MDDQDNKNNKDTAIDYFQAVFEMNGVAVSTVADGHVMMFKRTWLQALLDGNPDKPEFLIMIKKPDFKN